MSATDGEGGLMMVTITNTSQKAGGKVLDFVAYKDAQDTEEFLSWARHYAMFTGRRDFDNPEFWDAVEELVAEAWDE